MASKIKKFFYLVLFATKDIHNLLSGSDDATPSWNEIPRCGVSFKISFYSYLQMRPENLISKTG